ncbi:MAG: class II 3-deoxy-7-phosphoheptulonate synthase [Gammaproteobacteria bacterium]
MKDKIWSPQSWKSQPIIQQPIYPSEHAVEHIIHELEKMPPLVTYHEVDTLRAALAEAQQGKRFLLQGGDCAESFSDCHTDNITNKLKILLQMSLILLHGMKKPIIRVGRVAGQYAKPRSADTETRGNLTLPSYRGDLINEPAFTEESRTPNPNNMLKGYYYSAATLNHIRALVNGGFADLHHPEYWHLDFAKHSSHADDYENIANNIRSTLELLSILPGVDTSELGRVNLYTSHEALLLPYEQALTRHIPESGKWYNQSTHFPWIGMRTGQLDGAHIEYMRGIANPIAIKLGPTVNGDDLLRLIEVLNPQNEAGKLTLIHRMGYQTVAEKLPPLIEKVKQSGYNVLWSCDPMHGNTQTTANQYKTRRFDDILSELKQSFNIHRQLGTHLGGVHLELTGDNVTECTGGARGLTDEDLHHAYKSPVDPRLNYEQALEIAMLIANI